MTCRRPFRLDKIHPSVLGDTHSAWFGRKWVGTRRERILFNSGKDDDDANADADADLDVFCSCTTSMITGCSCTTSMSSAGLMRRSVTTALAPLVVVVDVAVVAVVTVVLD